MDVDLALAAAAAAAAMMSCVVVVQVADGYLMQEVPGRERVGMNW